jgi:ribonucleotide monophosphatase NagD (HAD superfamily)
VRGYKLQLINLLQISHFTSGDRLLTDIVFANQYGMYSVLVRPLNHYKDHPVAVIIRFVLSNEVCSCSDLIICQVRRTHVYSAIPEASRISEGVAVN